jgi:hypothetical protein
MELFAGADTCDQDAGGGLPGTRADASAICAPHTARITAPHTARITMVSNESGMQLAASFWSASCVGRRPRWADGPTVILLQRDQLEVLCMHDWWNKCRVFIIVIIQFESTVTMLMIASSGPQRCDVSLRLANTI